MPKIGKTYVARDPSALAARVVLWLRLLIAAYGVGLIGEIYRYRALSQTPSDTPVSFFETPPGLERMEAVTA
jgi:hypothetical protein